MCFYEDSMHVCMNICVCIYVHMIGENVCMFVFVNLCMCVHVCMCVCSILHENKCEMLRSFIKTIQSN